jgi:hypothetical protein
MNQIALMKQAVMLLRDGPDNHVQEAVDLLCQAIEQAGHIGHHEAHCYQDEYADSCKYGDDNCPMMQTSPAQPSLLQDPKDKPWQRDHYPQCKTCNKSFYVGETCGWVCDGVNMYSPLKAHIKGANHEPN